MSSSFIGCILKEILGEFGSDVMKEVIKYKILSLGIFVNFLFCLDIGIVV